MRREPRYTITCGDADYYFKRGRTLKESEVHHIFRDRILIWRHQLFPGLLVRNEQGQVMHPDLQVVLIPTEER
jgi:hypothetical protein